MLDKSFQEITSNIKNDITKTQLEIMTDANKKLVNLYFNIGKTLEENSSWGNKFIDNVAIELKMSFPNLKGFSVRNFGKTIFVKQLELINKKKNLNTLNKNSAKKFKDNYIVFLL